MALSRINRVYQIPQDLIDHYEKLPITRSGGIALAIHEAYQEPEKLGRALTRRLRTATETSPEKVKTGVTLSPPIVAMLEELAEKSQLSIEQVLRLVMEAYIHKV